MSVTTTLVPGASASAAPAPAPASTGSTAPPVATTTIGSITVYDDYVHHLQRIPPDSHPHPFDLRRHVASRVSAGRRTDAFLYERDTQFQLQMRTGPLVQSAFHTQAGEEWYYVLDGSAWVEVLEGHTVKLLKLTSGACCLLPGGTPKALQLAPGAVVLVMNRQRKMKDTYPHFNRSHRVAQLTHLNQNSIEPDDAPDSLLWLCSTCKGIAHREEFTCTDYFTQTADLIASFDRSAASGEIRCQTCKAAYPREFKTQLDEGDATLRSPELVETVVQQWLLANNVLNPACPAFPTIDPATHPPPYQLFDWIEANKHLLAPPVCNSMIHGRGTQWKVMIVGGPNQRTDYHIDDGEEWFLMLKGDMVLKVVDDCGTRWRDIPIREGESFLLPANVPHSPQRFANTIGLVIERERFTHELDGLRWWCSNEECRQVLRTFSFRCEDLGTQLKTLIQYWYEDSDEGRQRRTCKKCGNVETKPVTLDEVKQWTH